MFWDKLSVHIAPRVASFDVGRLVIVLKHLPLGTRPLSSSSSSLKTSANAAAAAVVEEEPEGLLPTSQAARGDFVAASSSSLSARADEIPLFLVVDLVQKLSLVPAWTHERIDPSLMSKLPGLATTALIKGTSESLPCSISVADKTTTSGGGGVDSRRRRRDTGVLSPKHVVLLVSAIGRLHAGALPAGLKEAAEAWAVRAAKTRLTGFELKHVAGLFEALDAAGGTGAGVREALEAHATALLLDMKAGEKTSPWIRESLMGVFGNRLPVGDLDERKTSGRSV